MLSITTKSYYLSYYPLFTSAMILTRYPTFNGHISNRPTLAPRDKSSFNIPLSRLDRPSDLPLLLPDSRLALDDFQSNGRDEDDFHLTSYIPSAVGLGIYYDMYASTKVPSSASDEVEDTRSVASSRSRPVSPSALDYHPEPLLDELYGPLELQLPTSLASSPSYSTIADSLSQESLVLQYPDLAPWSLESISASAGLTADEITTLALQDMASASHSSISSMCDLSSSEDLFMQGFAEDSRPDPHTWPDLPDLPYDAIGVYPVPNAQVRRLDSWKEPSLAINPAEIMADTPEDADVDYSYILFSPELEAPYLPHCCASDSSLPDDELVHERRRSPNFNGDIYVDRTNAVATSENGAYYHVHSVRKRNQKETSDYEISSAESSPLSPPRKRVRESTKPMKKSKQNILSVVGPGVGIPLLQFEPLVKDEPIAEDGPTALEGAADGINLGTPVFDAHRGIDLDELKSKAVRYRLRNPGREYDNSWLVSFVGKLSKQGELSDDFRCYVLGCDQVNKRRDHILIHVGGHLDQRPFRCRYWYVILQVPSVTL